MRVGVVGLGVVGAATAEYLRGLGRDVVTYDVNGSGSHSTPESLAGEVAAAVVCVPTPAGLMGRLDTSVVRHVCGVLREVPLVVVRSTVPVGTCRTLHGNVVYWPEFCNARSALADMRAAAHAFLGGPADLTARAAALLAGPHNQGRTVRHAAWEDAEALKLVTNAAMAVRVAFANEAKAVAEKYGADWAAVSRLLALDQRLGDVGWQVPGPDGLPGFGGACLPKDLAGFVAQAEDARLPARVADAARQANKKFRPEAKK